MKTISVSARAKSVKKLLDMAEKSDLIIKSADGAEFFLARITDTRAFYVGNGGDDFDAEVAVTRKNRRLMKFLDERRAKAKGKKGTSLAEVRRQLGH